MITVVIPTLDSEQVLVPTLAALVRGSAEGLVREVVLADGGSQDETRKIADAAGCEFLRGPQDEGTRLKQAATIARSGWLLFLDPGAVLDEGWTREVGVFVAGGGEGSDRAATFRIAIDGAGLAPRFTEATSTVRLALLGTPRPDQGLLIAKPFYDALGGHSPGSHPRRRLFARIGRGRLTPLRTRITIRRS
ncbi:MAG TPA: glycosyltransferase [Xanthobacteraceae bacterium]|jgi:glycosyltransferase involved in cell wall biosynthesis